METPKPDAQLHEQGRLVPDARNLPAASEVRVADKSPNQVGGGDEDDDDADFRALAISVWADSLADPGEDVYTLNDGTPIVSGHCDIAGANANDALRPNVTP